MNNNLIVISDSKKIADDFINKIVLLRKTDKILHIDFNTAINEPEKINGELLFTFLEDKENLIELQTLLFNERIKQCSVVALTNSYDEDILLDAFEMGVDDFITLNSQQSEILIRVMQNIKKAKLKNRLERKNEILFEENVLDKDTNFFSIEHTPKIFSRLFKKYAQENIKADFMILSADIKHKNALPVSLLASAIKKSIREDDIVGLGENGKFKLILENTTTTGAQSVFNKIKENISSFYTISAVATNITDNDYIAAENYLSKALLTALSKEDSYLYFDREKTRKIAGMIDKTDLKETNYKVLKNIFLKKYNAIVTPVFFQAQATLQDKLFEANIEQAVSETESYFIIKGKDVISKLTLKHPGFAKINADITHKTPFKETKTRITIDLNELSNEKIEGIIEKMLNDFQSFNA
ncbi:MAG: hypothetical protein PHV37_06250 [Candidatus Gastranaerophilales bacterium]|nr:hypothetical protein [Candidatus Gastranaerophilales bacterium]